MVSLLWLLLTGCPPCSYINRVEIRMGCISSKWQFFIGKITVNHRIFSGTKYSTWCLLYVETCFGARYSLENPKLRGTQYGWETQGDGPAVLVLWGAFSSWVSHETSWNPFFSQSLGFFLLGAASPSLECLQLRMIPVISLSHACVDHWHWQSGQSNETFLLRPDPRWSMAVYRITGCTARWKRDVIVHTGILGIPLNH